MTTPALRILALVDAYAAAVVAARLADAKRIAARINLIVEKGD